eukprot:2746644-Rhodomonas_salina.2
MLFLSLLSVVPVSEVTPSSCGSAGASSPEQDRQGDGGPDSEALQHAGHRQQRLPDPARDVSSRSNAQGAARGPQGLV